MQDFQLYKERKFNDFINDTIQFFRIFGKDYFKKYFVINGGIIFLFGVLSYFGYNTFFLSSQHTIDTPVVESHIGAFIGFLVLFVFVGIVYVAFCYGFPNVYFNNIEQDRPDGISLSDYLKGLFRDTKPVIVFIVVSIFVFLPIYLVVSLVSVLLFRFLIGYVILIASIIFLMSWFVLSMIVYVRDSYSGYFESLSIAWKMIFKNFWPIIGANLVLIFVAYLFQTLLSVIIMIVSQLFFMGVGTNMSVTGSSVTFLIYFAAFVLGSVFGNLVVVQQFLAYFSSVERDENIQAMTDLDSIGLHEK